MLLSIVIPVYNEFRTWRVLLQRVLDAKLPGLRKEILLVDDASTDGTTAQMRQFAAEVAVAGDPSGAVFQVLFHEKNRGKGAALRTGFAAASGDFVLVQDADLEYDPSDYAVLVEPLVAGKADVVYGSRFLHGKPRHALLQSYLANRFLTALANWTTGQKLTDMETCYKAFCRPVLQGISLQQDRFGFEPEVTAKLAAAGVKILEVPITYSGRTKAEGKKIGFKDGLNAIRCILRYRPRR